MSGVKDLVSISWVAYVALLAVYSPGLAAQLRFLWLEFICVECLIFFFLILLFPTSGSSVLSKPCSVTVANETSKKKVDVIDLTIESSSDEEEDPPAKRKCIFMSETQSSPTKGFVNL